MWIQIMDIYGILFCLSCILSIYLAVCIAGYVKYCFLAPDSDKIVADAAKIIKYFLQNKCELNWSEWLEENVVSGQVVWIYTGKILLDTLQCSASYMTYRKIASNAEAILENLLEINNVTSSCSDKISYEQGQNTHSPGIDGIIHHDIQTEKCGGFLAYVLDGYKSQRYRVWLLTPCGTIFMEQRGEGGWIVYLIRSLIKQETTGKEQSLVTILKFSGLFWMLTVGRDKRSLADSLVRLQHKIKHKYIQLDGEDILNSESSEEHKRKSNLQNKKLEHNDTKHNPEKDGSCDVNVALLTVPNLSTRQTVRCRTTTCKDKRSFDSGHRKKEVVSIPSEALVNKLIDDLSTSEPNIEDQDCSHTSNRMTINFQRPSFVDNTLSQVKAIGKFLNLKYRQVQRPDVSPSSYVFSNWNSQEAKSYLSRVRNRVKHEVQRRRSKDELLKLVSTSEQAAGTDQDRLPVDYQAVGEAAVAELLRHKRASLHVDVSRQGEQQDCLADGWRYRGLQHDIAILKRESKYSAVESYLGKGVVSQQPSKVYRFLQNPLNRLNLDSLLQRVDILHEFNQHMFILRQTQMVEKQGMRVVRDSVVLQYSVTLPDGRFAIALLSTSWPENNIDNSGSQQPSHEFSTTDERFADCERVIKPNVTATYLPSGWVVEPVTRDGKLCSMVTFVVQMEPRAHLSRNKSLLKELASQQPLFLARLRDRLCTETLISV